MESVYTISGAAPDANDYVELLGHPAHRWRSQRRGRHHLFGAPPSAIDVQCAQRVKTLVYVGGSATVGSAGVGLFGVYKLFKGRGAAGGVALLGAGVLMLAGRRLIASAAQVFERCRSTP